MNNQCKLSHSLKKGIKHRIFFFFLSKAKYEFYCQPWVNNYTVRYCFQVWVINYRVKYCFQDLFSSKPRHLGAA